MDNKICPSNSTLTSWEGKEVEKFLGYKIHSQTIILKMLFLCSFLVPNLACTVLVKLFMLQMLDSKWWFDGTVLVSVSNSEIYQQSYSLLITKIFEMLVLIAGSFLDSPFWLQVLYIFNESPFENQIVYFPCLLPQVTSISQFRL